MIYFYYFSTFGFLPITIGIIYIDFHITYSLEPRFLASYLKITSELAEALGRIKSSEQYFVLTWSSLIQELDSPSTTLFDM